MIKQAALSVIVLIFLMSLGGCQTMKYDFNPQKNIYAGPVNGSFVNVFKETKTAHFMFWGLAPVSVPDLNELAANAIGTDGKLMLAEVRISEENDFLNGFLAAITYGIYRPRTIEFSGKIYKKEGI